GTQLEDPGRPHRAEVGQGQVRLQARQPGEQAEIPRARRRVGARRRERRGHALRARLQRHLLLLPGLAAARALDRRAGRDQRGEELPERRRQHLPPVLRHDQGRRLPGARGERLPARAELGEHHRPGRRAGGALRPRVRRAAGQPLVRRRAGVPHLLRARADRAAAAARRLPAAREGDREGRRDDDPALRHARPDRGERARAGDRRPRRGHREGGLAPGRRGGPLHGRLRQRLLPVDQREGVQRDGDLAGVQEGRRLRQPVLHADPPHLHPAERRVPVEAHAHERVAAQRRAGVGLEEEGRHESAGGHPRGGARLLPRAQVPELRQPGAARHRLARRQGGVRRGAGRGPHRARRLPGLRRLDQAARPAEDRGALRQPVRDVRAHRRREPVRAAD
ncbi:MAG: Succinate dehydrogenase flavoprotein subunit, partial [uncultured Thermomicrobiales bacterium]